MGDKEAEAGLVSIRERKAGNIGDMNRDAFIDKLRDEVKKRA